MKSEKIIKKSDDYKSLDINNLDKTLIDLYNQSNKKYKDIIENIFNETVLEYSEADRPLPPYAEGTLDAPFLRGGKPTAIKALELYQEVLSGNSSTVEVEGSVRGGKDIYALLAWSRFLQVTPDLMHLALGTSLEHVLKTVLMSNGFGLFFLIPHGIFVRESISGAQRGAYKFVDNYGRQKQILFYGNDKENDSDKFQGFTLGSVYVNEALNQHVKGLNQAEFRISSALQPMIITTQNPKGKSASFYQNFERPKLIGIRQIEMMEFIRDEFGNDFLQLESEIKKDRDLKRKEFLKRYLKEKGVMDYKDLSTREQIEVNEKILYINFEFEKIIRDIPAQKFYKELSENDYAYNKSMKKIVHYKRGGENPNGIFNSYDFFYCHFTIDDNRAMSDMQRQDFRNKYAKGTSAYDQNILGIRRSTDSAVYNMFTSQNIFGGNIHDFDYTKTERIIVMDKGLNHPNGIIDCEVDFSLGKVWQLQESLLDFKKDEIENLGLESIYLELLRIIRARRNREMPISIVVDPSSIELIKYLRLRNLPVREANNSVWSIRGEKEDSHQRQDKDLIGIPFVQTAIAKLKYMVHESCVYTIEQIGSYEAPFDEKAGKEKVKKVHDDLVDPIRYLFNTYIKMGMWEGETERGEIETESNTTGISGDEKQKNSQRNLAREVAKAFYGDDNGFEESDFGSQFWNTNGFFDN